MRIVLVAPYFPPEVTGSSNFVCDIAIGLSELGHSVCVVTATDAVPHETFDVVSLKAKRIKPGRIAFGYSIPTILSRTNYRILEDLFDTFRPDIVSAHGQVFDITLLAASIAKKRQIPTVMTVHSAIWHDKPLLNLILTIGDKLLSTLFLKRLVRSWIAVDDRTLKHVQKRYSKICTAIPICVRKDVFAAGDREYAREKYGINGHPVIASIGHVVPVRNRIALVNSLPRIIEEFPDLQVVVVGRVADESFLERAETLGVSSHLRVLGAIPHTDIAHILATASVELHDLQGYGLGIGSLEAIDAGIPIVAYAKDDNIPGVSLRRYCSDGFIQQNDAKTISTVVAKLLNDGEFRQKILQEQKQLLSDVYYLERITSQYETEFENVLGL